MKIYKYNDSGCMVGIIISTKEELDYITDKSKTGKNAIYGKMAQKIYPKKSLTNMIKVVKVEKSKNPLKRR